MNLYDNFVDEYIKLSPSINEFFRLKKYEFLSNKQENFLSKKYNQNLIKLCHKYLNLLKNKSNHKVYDKVLSFYLKNELISANSDLKYLPINHQENFLVNYLDILGGNSYFTFRKKNEYIDFINKTLNYPEIIKSCISLMRHGIKKKIVLSKSLCKLLISQIEVSLKKKIYYNKKADEYKDLNFNKTIEQLLIPRIKDFIEFLKNEYYSKCSNKEGMSYLPNGKNLYLEIARDNLTLNKISIDQIHKYGKSECSRILKEMIEIKNKYNFDGNVQEFNKYLSKNNRYQFRNNKEILKAYKDMISNIKNTVIKSEFKDTIKHDMLLKPVPSHNEEFSGGAYYMPSDFQNTRKGTFYLNLGNLRSQNKLEVESLTLHEAYPGHHFQIQHMIENKKIPFFLNIYESTSYAEGWGLYCETLGRYNDDLSYYGKLNLEMLRSVRLVVDTGMHYYGWSIDKSFKFFKKYTFFTDSSIKKELHRYLAIPGQALAYKVGEKVILDLKQKYDGNNKDFHHKLLKNGNIPLEILIKMFDEI